MQRKKLNEHSPILGRAFHAESYTVGPRPELHLLMFGGVRHTPEEYAALASAALTPFDHSLTLLERELSFAFTLICAPYDLPFLSFGEHPQERQRWNDHVEKEILPKLPQALPTCLLGYAGGAALALHGLHLRPGCKGAAALGGDGLPTTFLEGAEWKEPLRLHYNRDDATFNKNRPVISRLLQKGSARVYRTDPGGHDLKDYLQNGSFIGLVRWACRRIR